MLFLTSMTVNFSCTTKTDTLFTQLDDTGIEFINENHETEQSNILSYEYFYNGGGVAIGDINNDGLPDIYFTSNIFSNKLYLNKGEMRFEDITERSGAACEKGWKTGVTLADVNADGLLDIYVCRSGSPDPERRRNILLINNGDLTFTDRAKEYNLDDPSYSTQAAFFDFDHDNDLDVFLLNHSLLEISNVYNLTVKNSDVRFPNVGNKLLRNDTGHFTDISDSVGIYGSAFNYGLGVSLSDVNNDGWTDLYSGCDYTGRDKLLINDHGKIFRDATDELSHISKFTMGTDIADINGDENMDILTLDMLPEDNFRQKQLMGADRYDVFAAMQRSGLHSQYMRNMLHLNNGDGTFSEIGQLAGVSNTDWSWSALIQDYNNDGRQDIFITNGFKRDLTNNDFAKFKAAQEIAEARKRGEKTNTLDVISKFAENKLPNYMFLGNGDLTFSNETEQCGFQTPTITNGAAYADLDKDGDLDIVTNNMNDLAGIYRNNAESFKNNFLTVKLTGQQGNMFAIGSTVTVCSGKNKWRKELFPVRGFESSVDYRLNFGLGKTSEIDSVIVLWPTGGETIIRNITINKELDISESSKKDIGALATPPGAWFTKIDAIDFTHEENQYNDFDVQRLLPQMYSTQGPALACADVNHDGLTDVFVGGAKGQHSQLFVQTSPDHFSGKFQKSFATLDGSEVVDAVFFDMDNDRDEDLYVVTGGYEFGAEDSALRDHLYENIGNGSFVEKSLPSFRTSGSCARPSDFDGDDDLDIFVGGRIIPGRYPETPESFILKNDGAGNFAIDEEHSEPIRHIGMVTDAIWVDLNKDQLSDLVVTAEWMPIKIFINDRGALTDRSSEYINSSTSGFWNCIVACDFDGDGDTDLAAGNYGLNNQMNASASHPVRMYYSDYDNNGSIDPILDYYIKDASYPYASRDELVEQLPSFKKRFTDYRSYSGAKINDVLKPEELAKSKVLSAENLNSCLFRYDSGKFIPKPLPIQFQFAPIFSILAADVNKDGFTDLLAGGNLMATRSRSGKLTGNCGIVALNNGKGEFKVLTQQESGLRLNGGVRHLAIKDHCLFVGLNNEPLLTYRLKEK